MGSGEGGAEWWEKAGRGQILKGHIRHGKEFGLDPGGNRAPSIGGL